MKAPHRRSIAVQLKNTTGAYQELDSDSDE
jgi:hypothetical protein